MQIDYIFKNPEHIERLARWHRNQWLDVSPWFTYEKRIKWLQQQTDPDQLPVTLVATDNNRVLGSASLVSCDLDSHPELTPWLASVFVAPRFRNNGIASRLIEEIATHASQSGFAEIYLFTINHEDFYRRRGWQAHLHEHYHGIPITIMYREL